MRLAKVLHYSNASGIGCIDCAPQRAFRPLARAFGNLPDAQHFYIAPAACLQFDLCEPNSNFLRRRANDKVETRARPVTVTGFGSQNPGR